MKSRSEQHDNYIIASSKKDMTTMLADETIFSQANGILGTRNHFIEGYGKQDYPQTFINGFYNTYPFHYEENYQQFPQIGQTIVNLPDASFTSIIFNGNIIDLAHCEMIHLNRTLDMKKGLVTRRSEYKLSDGTLIVITEEKLVPYGESLIISRVTIESSSEGVIELKSVLRMPLIKDEINKDPRLSQSKRHLDLLQIESFDHTGYLIAQTTESKLKVIVGINHDIQMDYQKNHQELVTYKKTKIERNGKIQFTKYQVYISELTSNHLLEDMQQILKHIEPFEYYLQKESENKQEFWESANLELSDPLLEKALRYNIYQLNLSGGSNSKMHIAAKGISGEGYEGHYFWDTETYMLPFFILTQPKRAKELLKYRYDKLDEAREEAKNLGCTRGAKIPWRTINGKESSPYYPAGSAQIHINSDIALAIINYYHATNDNEFMYMYGVEVLLETALFYLEYGHFKEHQFHLDSVTGPDEYTAIVNDNYYTNRLAKMHMEFVTYYITMHDIKLVPLLNRLKITQEDLDLMRLAANEMTLLIDQDARIIQQDQSFMKKKELNLSSISKNQFPLLLHYHPLFIYRHQVLKQADAVLAMVLMDDQPMDIYENTNNYYLQRTTHDSSLSKGIYGIAAYKLGRHALAYEYFKEVSELDLIDQRKHTRHGLHLANLGGSYLMLMYGILGLRMHAILTVNPVDQEELSYYKVHFTYQGARLVIEQQDKMITISTDTPIKLRVYGSIVDVEKILTFGVNKN